MSSGRIPSVEGGIQPTIFDAKADILTATAADTPARLAVGANDTVLTADSSTATGLKWAAPAAAGTSWTIVNSGGTSLSGATTTISGITGADKLMIILRGAQGSSAGADVYLRLNSDTGANYNSFGFQAEYASTYAAANFVTRNEFQNDNIRVATFSSNTASTMNGTCLLTGGNTTNKMMYQSFFGAGAGGGNNFYHKSMGGWYDATATISSISFTLQAGTWSAGTVYVYKSA